MTATQAQTTDWTRDARVPAILASIRRNPPVRKHFKVPSISSLYGRDDASKLVGADVDALERISNEYFLRAEANGGRDAALAFINDAPSVEAVIAYALPADKQSALVGGGA